MSDLRVPSGPGLPEGLVVPAEELVERFSRSSGPGGQSVNTTDSRVELVFEGGTSSVLTPAERERVGTIRVVATEHRSQHRNRVAARERLADGDPGRPRPATPAAGPHQAVEVLPPAPGRGQEAPRPDQGTARPGPRLTVHSCLILVESWMVRIESSLVRESDTTRPERGTTQRVRGATRRRRRPGRPTSTSSGPRSPASTKSAPMEPRTTTWMAIASGCSGSDTPSVRIHTWSE